MRWRSRSPLGSLRRSFCAPSKDHSLETFVRLCRGSIRRVSRPNLRRSQASLGSNLILRIWSLTPMCELELEEESFLLFHLAGTDDRPNVDDDSGEVWRIAAANQQHRRKQVRPMSSDGIT